MCSVKCNNDVLQENKFIIIIDYYYIIDTSEYFQINIYWPARRFVSNVSIVFDMNCLTDIGNK